MISCLARAAQILIQKFMCTEWAFRIVLFGILNSTATLSTSST